MTDRVLLKGNEAAAEGAIAGGCRYFFCYPITPQNQIPEYMAAHMHEVGGVFVQAESEVAAINMVYGAAATGVRTMTSSSSPGVSLMQEGLSYMLGSELPCVIINMVRGGPGLGNIAPAQSDYWLSTRGCGHGDGRCITFAPYSVQELHDWTADAFAIAEKYRNPVTILGDAILAQMMEPCRLRPRTQAPDADLGWNVGGIRNGRERRVINSLWTDIPVMEAVNERIQARYEQAAREDTHWAEYGHDEPDVLICAYGSSARIAETVIDRVNATGMRCRLLRPISLFPFPTAPIREWAGRGHEILSFELSMGQMVEDVRLAANGACPVTHYGRAGGAVVTPEMLEARLRAM
jgi:2-oxoglutarate/2-oxoacid ferredoxin oxidoreductase subunit alpha